MNDTFGARLRRARIQSRISVATVSRSVGVDPTTVWRWERNAVRPYPENMEALAAILGSSAVLLPELKVKAPEKPVARIMPMLESKASFADFLDARIADLQRQVAITRAMREALA